MITDGFLFVEGFIITVTDLDFPPEKYKDKPHKNTENLLATFCKWCSIMRMNCFRRDGAEPSTACLAWMEKKDGGWQSFLHKTDIKYVPAMFPSLPGTLKRDSQELRVDELRKIIEDMQLSPTESRGRKEGKTNLVSYGHCAETLALL
jgi:hypothetical protein